MRRSLSISILLVALITQLSFCQQCTTKISLDNILQDQIVFNPVSPQGSIYENQQYFYPRTFFSSTPKIIYSIQNYQVNSFSQINYVLKANVSRSYVTFTFTAENMYWTSLKVKFWLTARADLLVGSFTLQNISPGSSSEYNITIPSTFSPFVNQKSIQLNYITGLKATTESDLYQIDVQNSGRSEDNAIFRVKVSALGSTSITSVQVSYTIFNFELSYFASGGGQINYTPISSAQYKKIHGSFAPIIYEIQGIDKLRFSKNAGFNLEFSFDSDLVLETSAGNKFDQLGVVYLSIGAQPVGVCSCNQFIMKSGCVDSCPAMTYPFVDYAKGGKSCLTCSPKFNETINEFSTGCVCLQGLERVNDYCIPKAIKVTECLATNTVLSNDACVCITGTHLINGNCESICKQNENYNSGTSKCECNFGYYNISGACGVCSSDKTYNADYQSCVCPQYQYIGSEGTCQCIPNYAWMGKTCVSKCPTGYVKSGSTCVVDNSSSSTNCSTNQILTNGKCVCSSTTYPVNGTCTTCPTQTYYNVTSQTCIHCLANCDVCFNYSSCSTCKSEYYYDQTSNACHLNRTCLENQVLTNGVCVCSSGTVEVAGVCTTCLAGTFYNAVARTCQSCVLSCLACSNATSCVTCLPNYSYNLALGYCAPICGANETLVNGNCECIGNTYRLNGVCTKCPSTQFYDSSTKTCQACMLNCISCTGASSCDKCIQTHYFNPTTKACEPSNCPVNQTIVNGKCDCVQNTYRIVGTCGVCKAGEFYNSNTQTCKQCQDNCVKCLNLVQCGECQAYFKLVNNECRFNLYDLKQGSPQFTDKVVITDFTSSQPLKARKLTPSELKNIARLQFDSTTTQVPSQTIIQQNPNNLSEIRVIFAYCGYIPFENQNVTYTFNDPVISIKEDIDTVKYNVLEAGLKSYLTS